MNERAIMRMVEQQVRRDLPGLGKRDYLEVNRLASGGVHAWGRTEVDGQSFVFLICRTPNSYPSATVLLGDSLAEILDVLVTLGIGSGLELEQLLCPAVGEN